MVEVMVNAVLASSAVGTPLTVQVLALKVMPAGRAGASVQSLNSERVGKMSASSTLTISE